MMVAHILIHEQRKLVGTIGDRLVTPHVPTPEEADHVFFLLRWWREFTLGLIGLLSSVALIKKGRNLEAVPVYLTDTTVKAMFAEHQKSVAKDMKLCELTLQTQMREEFYTAMGKNNDNLIDRFKELLDAHHS